MKKIVLVVLIFFSNISIIIPAELDYFLFPLIRFSYDFNLGFTTSIGGGVMFTKGEAIGGPYFLYSFSIQLAPVIVPSLPLLVKSEAVDPLASLKFQ